MHVSTISILAPTLSVSASPLFARQIASIEETTQVSDSNQDVGNADQNAGNPAANKGKYTVEQGVETCGNAQLNCCNKIEMQGDTTNAGLLGSVFGSRDIGIQCSPINLPAVIGVQVPINKQCDAKAACCQGEVFPGIAFPSPPLTLLASSPVLLFTQNGLINLGCVALASLI
ncbi:unnamed protein product [Tuber aestivum]|uniref:Hydrophobin n=1 Tax=Tuber aestivum TaxID=59557 RepID=A0A292PYJ2_9PEZI|nr:unnamed protein product [Tuber aestivum]